MPSRNSSGSGAKPSKYAAVGRASNGGAVSYGGVDGNVLRDCLEAVTGDGDAILFGKTSDGGALSVQVLSGGVATKFYPADVSEPI